VPKNQQLSQLKHDAEVIVTSGVTPSPGYPGSISDQNEAAC
jgi:hypothetical protein